MKLLVINGPNLNMLGIREPDVYGTKTFDDLEDFIRASAKEFSVDVTLYQTNHEGEIVDMVQSAYGVYDGIIINPAAYTHTSVAILDALKAVAIPTVEVHLSDVDSREDFRKISYVALVAKKRIYGLGFEGYREAIKYFINSTEKAQ